MKTLVTTIALVLVVACSAAQKQAENDLAVKGGQCAVACGVKKAILHVPAKDAIPQCAAECGIDLLTNPNAWQDLGRIIAGAQDGVAAAARDGGAPDASP